MKRWIIFFTLIIGILLTGCEYKGHDYEVLGYCEQDGLYYYTRDGIVQSTNDPGMFASHFYGHAWCPFVPIPGCMDEAALNYNPEANVDDGSCIYYEVCSEQVGPVFGDWSAWVLIGDTWERSRSVTFYDARNQQHVCSSDVEYDYRAATQGCTDPRAENFNPDAEYDDGSCAYYEACSETITSFDEWEPWKSAGTGEGEIRTRIVTILDARDQETVCDQYTERQHQCTRLFIMWLLEGTHPNASGPLQCYVVSPTHPSVDRYQRICWPCQYPDFIASRAVAGWVDSCDQWSLDSERLYWRKSLTELLAMNARHAEGIYYLIECCEVE